MLQLVGLGASCPVLGGENNWALWCKQAAGWYQVPPLLHVERLGLPTGL